jgi:hypothetical protein
MESAQLEPWQVNVPLPEVVPAGVVVVPVQSYVPVQPPLALVPLPPMPPQLQRVAAKNAPMPIVEMVRTRAMFTPRRPSSTARRSRHAAPRARRHQLPYPFGALRS